MALDLTRPKLHRAYSGNRARVPGQQKSEIQLDSIKIDAEQLGKKPQT